MYILTLGLVSPLGLVAITCPLTTVERARRAVEKTMGEERAESMVGGGVWLLEDCFRTGKSCQLLGHERAYGRVVQTYKGDLGGGIRGKEGGGGRTDVG